MSEFDSSTESESAAVENEGSGLLSPDLGSTEAPEEEQVVPHRAQTEEKLVEGDGDIDWGDRPEWMPENFWDEKDGPDLEALAKSYQEMRTKMSAGKHKAPKDGSYDIAALKDHGIEEDDALLSEFKGFAKENGLSQDQFDQITQMYVQHVNEMMGEADTNREAELSKLGPKGDKIVGSLNQWLTKLGTSGALSHEEVDAIASKADNANFIMALNKIRASYGEQPIPDINVQEGQGTTKADLDAMVADPRYGKDMHYTNNVERKFMEFFGEV